MDDSVKELVAVVALEEIYLVGANFSRPCPLGDDNPSRAIRVSWSPVDVAAVTRFAGALCKSARNLE